MILLRLLTILMLLPLPVLAEDDECAEIRGLESKAYEDLQKYVKFVEKSPRRQEQCEELYDKVDAKYLELSTLVYKQYRDYLNRFLATYAGDSKEVQSFLGMAQDLASEPGASLIKINAEKKNKASEEALLKFLTVRYKHRALNPPVLQNCEFVAVKPKKGSKKPVKPTFNNDLLITGEPRLNDANVCAKIQDTAGYPSYQRSVRFQVKDGRALVHYCHQRFETAQDKSLKEVRANCLSYDLAEKKQVLGDLRANHIHGGNKPFEINDYRSFSARSHGYVPLTYSEFLNKNGGVLNDPRNMYSKLPKDCVESKAFTERVEKARGLLSNMESKAVVDQ